MPIKAFLVLWILTLADAVSSGIEPSVTAIDPTTGSLEGGTMIHVHGEGFANDQFSFLDANLGNIVLFKSDKHEVECDIVPTDVSDKRIACETRRSPTASEGEYQLMMFVNGKEVTKLCERRKRSCKFMFYKWSTPTISNFEPRAAVPGTPVTISGLIHTTQFSRLSQGFSPDQNEITRVYVGLECNPFNDEVNELFGAKISNCGFTPSCLGSFTCLPKARTAGSHSASYLVSGIGRSQVDKNLWRVDKDQDLYIYQTHSDIHNVFPSSGSLEGGTVVTIDGLGFSENPANVKVFVSGVECEIVTTSVTRITCVTGPRGDTQNIYPGSRGLLREIWKSTVKSNLLDIASLTSDAADHHVEFWNESGSPDVDTFQKTSGYSSKITGFFVPLHSDNYTFYIRSDDISELYLSTGAPADKVKIASCSAATRDWFQVQKSERIALEANTPYYIEAYHTDFANDHHVSIRVGLEKTSHTNAKVGAARDEKQQITISSTLHWEIQSLDLSNWNEDEKVCEVQQISITILQCEEVENNVTSCSNNFTLFYDDEAITLSLEETSSSVLEDKLKGLQAFQNRGTINVTSVDINDDNTTVFQIWFCFTDPRGMGTLNGTVFDGESLSLNITRLVSGQLAQEFQLFFDDQPHLPSDTLQPSFSKQDIEEVLENWFSVKCEFRSRLVGYMFYEEYEGDIQGRESGERISDKEPFCGRYSLQNPTTIWKEGYTGFFGISAMSYRISRYKEFCFAYKGPIKDELKFQIKYEENGGMVYKSHVFPFVRSSSRENWGFSCVNVWDHVQTVHEDEIALKAEMHSIEIVRLGGEGQYDIFIDNVWIGKNPIDVARTRNAVKPNGFLIKEFNIEKNDNNWTISLLPANCGSQLPLLSVVNTERSVNSTRERASFTVKGLTSNLQVTRVQKASPRVRGTFDIEYQGKVIGDVPANISETRLKDRLEEELEEGILAVERSGTCAGFTWTVTWETRGGDHPEMRARGDNLDGNEVSISVQTIENGGLFLDPIPGEFLRTPHSSGQVVVFVNDIVGSCNSNNCSFNYSNDQTPQLSSISPTSGIGGPFGVGTVITLGGSGFSTENEDNVVTIGGSRCVVQTSTEDNITCRADYGPGGSQEVKVSTKGKGMASNVQRLNFTYVISATSVTPSSGSTAGGSKITIYGSGFGNDIGRALVSLDGETCDVKFVNMSHIICVTGAHIAGTVSVEVSIDDSSATISNGFVYDASLNIQVTSLSPQTGTVSGGDIITISGSGFQNTTEVEIGSDSCLIQSLSSVEITCVTPRHSPGKFVIRVITPEKGFAVIPDQYQEFEFVFSVHSIFPLNGSLAGGTFVTITGRGFNCNASRTLVTLHNKPCQIKSCNETYMVCESKDIFETIVVENRGSHPEFGRGYEWDLKYLTCHQGDSVEWRWYGQMFSEVYYSVHQTVDSSTDTYDGTGFSSALSKTGSFKHRDTSDVEVGEKSKGTLCDAYWNPHACNRFLEPGVYYYSGSGSVPMKGVVKVLPFKSLTGPISLKIDGYEALYNLSSPTNSFPSCESGRIDPTPGCNSSSATDASGRSFTYTPCSMPRVSSVSPLQGTSNTVITIHGDGFSDESCHNEVSFNSHVCQVIFSNETTITCRLSTAGSPPAGEQLHVVVRVLNRGLAFFETGFGHATTFTLQPSVTDISPSSGSQAGGTRIAISGYGFSNTIDDNSVLIGDATCDVVNSTYTELTCITRARNTNESQQVVVRVAGSESECGAARSADCEYTFATDRTPVVSTKIPNTITIPHTEFRFMVSGLPSETSDVSVKVGNAICNVTSVASSMLTCEIEGVAFGSHKMVIHVSGKGNAQFNEGVSDIITSEPTVSSVSPLESSINGGLTVTVTGNGFDPSPEKTSVTIGNAPCEIVSVTYGEIMCRTPPHAADNSVTLQVAVGEESSFPASSIAYTISQTPVVSSLSQQSGKGGDTLILYGSGLEPLPSYGQVLVNIGDAPCEVTSSTPSNIVCTLAAHAAGSYEVDVVVPGKGRASPGFSFEYSLNITSASPNESGFGGGRVLLLQGYGFENSAVITICGNNCTLQSSNDTTTARISCEAPAHPGHAAGVDQQCDLVITVNGITYTLAGGFTYKVAMTSTIMSVTPPRGGTGGGTTLNIRGTGFSSTASDNVVTIDGTPCVVSSASTSQIVCTTGRHSRTIESKVRVDVGTKGKAVNAAGYFFYVDVWSSKYTWGNNPPPISGDVVVIKKGQTILLDIDTPVLKLILIQGGKLTFDIDKPSLHLQAENILIAEKGALEVGTEDRPFPGSATITLHGHVRSREIPVFGTKTIALREGTLDLHGLHVPITWTHLAVTANIGERELHLMQAVTWKPGDQIILAPTGKSQREFEELTITGVSNGNKTLQITPALKYKHISIAQTFNGMHRVETRAEVGLLTRNVRVRGSKHSQWEEVIEACPAEFAPGQFQTQTCFQGKFGEEIGSDEFGVQIMIHAPEEDKDLVQARFSHVEIFHAGQAFRLGRYPIHFHLSGSVKGSYVIGCAIHHSFNRAITMHGIDNLLVSRNVVFNVRGNALFMEDGIETGNVVQYNLAVFVIASSSALNVDITPAAYWVTNANNTIRHNAAAGGSHFGYWYQMFANPDGPSFTKDYCPRNVFMHEFFNNSAHSFGRYGLWIFPTYHPLRGGRCNSDIAEPAVFNRFLAYNNMRGAEAVQVGAVQMHNFDMLDNDIAGIEYVFADMKDAPRGGPLIKNALIVGHSQASEGLQLKISSNTLCTTNGIRLPQFSKLVVENVTFVNFDRSGCTCYATCAQCLEFKKKGGWTTHTSKNHFVNAPRRTALQWAHEAVILDLDGSFTGFVRGSVVPTNDNLPPQHCNVSAEHSYGPHSGSICDGTVKFRRLAFNNVKPSSLLGKTVLLTNSHGTDEVPFCLKCATHPNGWLMTVIVGDNYTITFETAEQITNITYSALFYDLEMEDHVWISHNFTQKPDHFTTTGQHQNITDIVPYADAQHGDWSFVNETKVFTYIASGKDGARSINNNIVPRGIELRCWRCFYKDCITPIPPPPPKGRPAVFRRWSNVDDWEGTEPLYGGFGRRLPHNGSDVVIQEEWYMLADTQLPYLNKLLIYGTLEIEDRQGEDMVINASLIFITGGLIVGWPDKPYLSNLLIILQGDIYSEEYEPTQSLEIGSKAIAVFGFMWLHGKPKSVCWTKLAETAEAGDRHLQLVEPVDWSVGDEIVITSTTVEPRQAEKFRIVAISSNRLNLTLDTALQFKHIAETHKAGNWTYTLAAEVGHLTNNILIKGAENSPFGWQKSFGCRVLVKGLARIEYVEISYCGQEGWIDDYDPRFSLAFVMAGDVEGNTSYVRCNAIHDGFNTGIGVFWTNNLTVEDNVVYHSVGSSIQVAGKFNRVLRNLAVYSIAIGTYNGRREIIEVHWLGALEVHLAENVVLINNTVAGSERFGFRIDGVKCTPRYSQPENSAGNEVHGAWHGIHVSYEDGISDCSMIYGYLTWRNLDYGLFSYPQHSVVVDNLIAVDNTVGVIPYVWGPAAVSHRTANKYFILRNSLVVGTSPNYDCADDGIVTYAKAPYGSYGAKKTKEGGKIGITITHFASNRGPGPRMPWEDPGGYPAINGYTFYEDVTFSGFQETCGKRHRAIMTNNWIGDIFHPVDARGLIFDAVDEASKLFFEISTTRWINPSDCVDMDCDGRRQVLFRDLDGSVIGSVGSAAISMAEYEWDGDPRFGLGDYRIPKEALTTFDGTRLSISVVAPHKGIVRGTRNHSICSWYADWNAYKCNSDDYRMLVIESLDADTETRRLSPVALIANGYVNLLNGPQDHGWCLGYTCQERISTFYGIVATGTNYSLYFTSYAPQNLKLHLLNSDSTEAIRIGLFFKRAQRRDVYVDNVYIFPTNGEIGENGYAVRAAPAGAHPDYFVPPLTSYNGANYFDRVLQTLYLILRGPVSVEIRTPPVVQVQIGVRAVSIDDFFKENLLSNLVQLLDIDPSRVRIVDIVSESSSRRRRKRSAGDDVYELVIEIGDPPLATNGSVSSSNSSSNYTGVSSTSSVEELKQVGDSLVEKVQTGELSQQAQLEVVSLSITDPLPEPVDPTGGVRATNETGGSNITDNSTLRYDQLQAQEEAEAPSNTFSFLIPNRLVLVTEPNGGNETVPFTIQPKLKLVDIDGELVTTLGHGSLSNWTVTASILNGTGDPMAVLEGNMSVTFVEGWANFTDLSITHNASDYKLLFNVSKPAASHFNATSQVFEVKERILYFTVTVQPGEANETVNFGKQPRIEVRDAANSEIIDNTGWKGRKWVFFASIANPEDNEGHLNGTTMVEFAQGVAQFTNLSVDISGENYILELEAATLPPSSYAFSVNSSSFNVSERLFYLKMAQQPGDCNDTVICGSQPIPEIRTVFPDALVDNIGWRGRTWQINATMVGVSNSVINGTTLISVPTLGRVEFLDLNFYDVAQGYRIEFAVITEPSSSYSGLSETSDAFNVSSREFYLQVITQPGNANQSEIFGVAPVVEVRDVATRLRGDPLKGDWSIAVSLKPSALNGTLNGVLNETVIDERAEFSNLSISYYGTGYELAFQSSYGHTVNSQPFEVKYVNDYSPVFEPPHGFYNATLSEDALIGVFVTTVTATDRDSGSQGDVYYSIVAGNTGNKFEVDSVSGNITTLGELDRETIAVFTLTVRASDGAVPEKVRYADGTVEVIISDINDNAPSFNTPSIAANFSETASVGDVVFTLQATDPDEGLNSELRYSILSGNEAELFVVDSVTGDVKVNKSCDLEQESMPVLTHSLVIFVKDLGTPQSLNSSVILNITITPANEFTPQLLHEASFNFIFAENADVGDGVLVVQVNATDEDFGDQGRISYVIDSGNSEGKFMINTSSGELRLVSTLDYETSPSYTLIIQARDNDPEGNVKYAVFSLHVTVLDMNDNVPTFSQSQYSVNVGEDAVLGSSVFTFFATDPDSGLNGLISYSMVSSDSSEFWRLNSSTGELIVNASLDMDKRQITTWTNSLLVIAKDSGTPMLYSNTTLLVHVLLRNEFAPSFPAADVSVTVREDIAEGSVIYRANASDADFGSDGEIRYSIIGGNDGLMFFINPITGEITTLETLDRESQGIFDLVVQAEDQSSSVKKTGTTTVHLSLTDVNDNPPSFSNNRYSTIVNENVPTGGKVFTVAATDPDLGTNGDLVYSITSGNERGLFSIESIQGIIRAAKSLDLETQNHSADHTYNLDIFVTDRGSPIPLNNSVPVTITVQSVNEFSPVLQHSDNQVIELSENASLAYVVFDVNATDDDFGEDGILSYSITAGNNLGVFTINSTTDVKGDRLPFLEITFVKFTSSGVITLAKALDFETISQHNLVINVSDSSSEIHNRRQVTATLQIRVVDIQDSVDYAAEAKIINAYIASPANPAGVAGLPHKSALEIRLVYKNGSSVLITAESHRYTLDDVSKSNNLFRVITIDGTPFVVANSDGMAGFGELLVHVTNVQTLEVNVTVVGDRSFSAKALLYPEIPGASEVSELKQIIPGIYQRVLVTVLLDLTNGDQVDVSNLVNTTFAFAKAQQVGGSFAFGPNPQNLFSISGHGLSGIVSLQVTFAQSLSANVNLTLSSTILEIVGITRFGLKQVNSTLSGFSGVTTALPFAELTMSDGSIHLLDNFTMYSGLLTFRSSDVAAASVDLNSGVVTLLSDSHSIVTITATALSNTSVTATIAFYCNLLPGIGEVDIGASEGSAIPSLIANDIWRMPIRINAGALGILAVHVKISFSTSDLRLDNVVTDLPYSVSGNMLNIFGPLQESKALSDTIAEAFFTSLRSGVPRVNVSFSRTVDKELRSVPTKLVTSCSNVVLGDIDLDCSFDIVDVAFIVAYAASSKTEFTDSRGTEMKAVSSSQKSAMDVNWNEAVGDDDAVFLSFIYLEKAKFVTSLNYQLPNRGESSSDKCGLQLAVKLANKDGTATSPSQAEAYFLFSHSSEDIAQTLIQTIFILGTKINVEGSSPVKGLIKADYQNEKFLIAAENSALEASEIGVSIVQYVFLNGQKYVASMFMASDLISTGELDASWISNQASKGFTPQRKLQLLESTERCHDPLVTMNMMITFEGEYDTIVKGKEEEFEKHCVDTLSGYYPEAIISDCKVSKGSIMASFNMTVPESKRNATVAKVWDDVVKGMTLDFNGETITTLPRMQIDGQVFFKEPVATPQDQKRMSVVIIVVACVAAFVVILVAVIIVYIVCRRKRSVRVKVIPSPPGTPDTSVESEKGREHSEHESKYMASVPRWDTDSPQFKRPTPLPVADIVEPAFEEEEDEQILDAQEPVESMQDPADPPKTVLAFPKDSYRRRTPSPLAQSQRSVTSLETSSSSPRVTSSGSRVQSPALSLSGLRPHLEDDGIQEGIRQDAQLRRRGSSFDQEQHIADIPGALTALDSHIKRINMKVKVIRPNPGLGVLAHMAGVVKVNPSGTLDELRQDICSALPAHLGSVRFLLLSRKFKIIDPRTESQLVVSGVYKETVYVKVFHGAENCEYFCRCGNAANVWCPRCNVQGYCGDHCREQDEGEHEKFCSSKKAIALEAARTRRLAKANKQ